MSGSAAHNKLKTARIPSNTSQIAIASTAALAACNVGRAIISEVAQESPADFIAREICTSPGPPLDTDATYLKAQYFD